MSSEPGTFRVGDLSTNFTSIPARRSAIALLRPAGPAPTISTFETAPIAPPNKEWATLRYRRSRTLVPHVPIEGRPGDAQGLTDLPNGVPLILSKALQLLDLLGCEHFGSAKQSAARPGSSKAGVGALPDEIPLELGQCPEDMEDELAAAGGGVQLFLERAETDAP